MSALPAQRSALEVRVLRALYTYRAELPAGPRWDVAFQSWAHEALDGAGSIISLANPPLLVRACVILSVG